MGWTYTRDPIDLNKARQQHEWESTRYGSDIKAELIANEWHAEAWFAIIKLTYPENHDRHPGKVITWLRIDLIDTAGGTFGYKDGSEDMGMFQAAKPSKEFAKLIYQHIPRAEGYAPAWRDRNGVKYDNKAQEELFV